jgi:tRNA(Ile)-lysidine synthase
MAYEFVAGTGKDFEKKHIDYIIENTDEGTHGNIIELPFNTVCFAEYDKICFSIREKAEGFSVTIKPGEQIEITQAKMIVTAEYVDIKDVVFEENTEYFDLNVESVTLRSFENGDKIIPLGKTTSKKIKEIFINKKIPARERMSKIIVEADEILCVLGVCRSDCFKINENTKKVLMIKGGKIC